MQAHIYAHTVYTSTSAHTVHACMTQATEYAYAYGTVMRARPSITAARLAADAPSHDHDISISLSILAR